jgi:hypothetical protein
MNKSQKANKIIILLLPRGSSSSIVASIVVVAYFLMEGDIQMREIRSKFKKLTARLMKRKVRTRASTSPPLKMI